jgi:uncharacterized LabA/DUF88 family protein
MIKAMIFIDGTWLFRNRYLLSKKFGSTYKLDYGKLPHVLADIVSKSINNIEIDIVRTYLFGSIPKNYDPADKDLVTAQENFFNMLKEQFHYEIETYSIDYRGHKIKQSSVDTEDDFTPKEKCVDIALASKMLYYAAMSNAYDVAITVIGDKDYIPALQYARNLGKRVAIVSIEGSCADEYKSFLDPFRVKDFDVIWMNDLLERLKIEERTVPCESPHHAGDRNFLTSDFMRKGYKYYCPECRAKHNKNKLKQ